MHMRTAQRACFVHRRVQLCDQSEAAPPTTAATQTHRAGTWPHEVTVDGGAVVVTTAAGRSVRIPCTQHPKPADVSRAAAHS
jgi:endonuclease YncB( thermonuclease family)